MIFIEVLRVLSIDGSFNYQFTGYKILSDFLSDYDLVEFLTINNKDSFIYAICYAGEKNSEFRYFEKFGDIMKLMITKFCEISSQSARMF